VGLKLNHKSFRRDLEKFVNPKPGVKADLDLILEAAFTLS
jgi:hypothetical protein